MFPNFSKLVLLSLFLALGFSKSFLAAAQVLFELGFLQPSWPKLVLFEPFSFLAAAVELALAFAFMPSFSTFILDFSKPFFMAFLGAIVSTRSLGSF